MGDARRRRGDVAVEGRKSRGRGNVDADSLGRGARARAGGGRSAGVNLPRRPRARTTGAASEGDEETIEDATARDVGATAVMVR